MTADRDPVPTPAELLAAYADDPRALSPAERAAVEDLLARDPDAVARLAATRATLAAVRASAPAGEPDWDRLHAGISRALDDERPRRRAPRRLLAVGGLALAAAAAALLLIRADERTRPAPTPDPVAVALDAGAPPTPAPALDRADELDPLDTLDVSDDLGGGLALDEVGLDDEEPEPEPEPDVDLALDDEPGEGLLPDSGWIDTLSDEELDRALEWLEAHEPRKAG